nr:hypothetical protein [uncultured Campylobacter sp.]
MSDRIADRRYDACSGVGTIGEISSFGGVKYKRIFKMDLGQRRKLLR